jgi:hypothetical protein
MVREGHACSHRYLVFAETRLALEQIHGGTCVELRSDEIGEMNASFLRAIPIDWDHLPGYDIFPEPGFLRIADPQRRDAPIRCWLVHTRDCPVGHGTCTS